ncbi:chaperone protein dnaJ 20, chloroplastic-like [Typha latifolia]|uniref:chaperone protein dnaJ 20, chloroplastic-like n=1 Tax=Typha latifolia TaxID=4733 RepID=UPI003C2DEC42
MSAVLPGSNIGGALHPCPELSTTRIGGGDRPSRLLPWRRRQPRLPKLISSAFKTKAAVGEGGLLEEKKGSFYELLGISEEGSLEEIKKAYKKMARKYHPDVSPPDRAEEHTRRFIEVQEAYETLSDPSRRALYDRRLARGLHFAFSTRTGFDEELEERSLWKNRWNDQVAELKRRSMSKDSEENLSWGARMRRKRAESSIE